MDNNKQNEAVQNDEELNIEESEELSDEELDDVTGGGALLSATVAGIMMMSAAAPTITAAAEQPALVETYSPEKSDAEIILDTVDGSVSGLKAESSAPDRISASSRSIRNGNASIVYPFKRYFYRVEIDGQDVGGFSEISAPILSDPIEYQTEESVKQPGVIKYGNLILKCGATSSTVFYDWIRDVREGEVTRKDITITLLDDTETGIAMWQITKAWPIKCTFPDNNASSSGIAIETVELAHEGIARIK